MTIRGNFYDSQTSLDIPPEGGVLEARWIAPIVVKMALAIQSPMIPFFSVKSPFRVCGSHIDPIRLSGKNATLQLVLTAL